MAKRKQKTARRKKRSFSAEFKAEATRMVLEEGLTVAQAARDLDLTESSLRNWVRQAEVDAGRGLAGALTSEERAELGRLRKENKRLRMEREILKKAAVTSTSQGNASRNTSSGVLKSRVFRGRVFNSRAILFS